MAISLLCVVMDFFREVKWRLICAEIAIGSVAFLYNFSSLLHFATTHGAPHWLANATVSLIQLSDSLLTVFTGTGAAWSPLLSNCLVIGLWWYIAVVVIASIIHRRPDRLTNGLSGLCVGLGAIVLLSWAAFVLVKFAVLLFWISRFISSISTAVFHFIASIPHLAVVAIVLFVGYVLFSLFRKLGFHRVLSAFLLLPCAALAWLLRPVLRWCYFSVLLPVVHFLEPVVAWVLGALGAIFVGIGIILVAAGLVVVLRTMGKLLFDQFRTARDAPKGDKAMAFAGFSVGSTFAVLLMVTAGLPDVAASIDTAWHQHAWLVNTWSPAASHFQALPGDFADEIASIFKHASAPVFDTLILIALLPVSAFGAMQIAKKEEMVWTAEELRNDAKNIAEALAKVLGFQVMAGIFNKDS